MRKSGKSKRREGIILLLLVVVLFFTVIYTISIGSTSIAVKDVFQLLIDKLFFQGKGIEAGQWSNAVYQIVWNVRLPRVLFGACCGAGLALCGSVMQALVMNPVADPYILGISSGASAGAAWALLMPLPFFAGQYQTTVMALLGALLSSFCVYTMAKFGGKGKLQPVTLLLSGTAVNAVMSAITSFLIFLAKSHESITAVYNWQMGSLAAAQWSTLRLPVVGVIAGLIIFTWKGGKFNLMMMGDEDASALGLDVSSFRRWMFALCSLVVATLVSVTGIIGFVGLMVPHIVRLLTGTSDNRCIIPYSALLGASYLVCADAAARSLFGAAELPIGIITAFVGAPFFFYLMIRKNYGGKRS